MALQRNLTDKSYADFWGPKKIYFPIDNYDLELKNSLDKLNNLISGYHIIKIPLLGQFNTTARKMDWCGRCAYAMIYNYRKLIESNGSDPKDLYIKHWKPEGEMEPAVLNPEGKDLGPFKLKGQFSYSRCEYLFKTETQPEDRIRLAKEIKNNPTLVNKKFDTIIKSLLMGNPVLMYSGFSVSKSHIISICGFVYIAGELWIAIADPEADGQYGGRYKKGLLKLYKNNDVLTNEHNDITLINGDWNTGRARLRLTRASHFFNLHPLFKKRLFLDDNTNTKANDIDKTSGFYICSPEKLEVPPELIESTYLRKTIFPVQADLARPQPPSLYYASNETRDDGYYTAGQNQNIHAGIHLDTNVNAHKVRSCMPGYIVAMRFAPPVGASKECVETFLGTSATGFVLMCHKINYHNKSKPEQIDESACLYSLYMHLDKPDHKKYMENVPWYKEFFKYAHGSVTNLDLSTTNPGEVYPSAKPVADGDSTFSVLKDSATVELSAMRDDKQIAFGKAPPADVSEAIAALGISLDGQGGSGITDNDYSRVVTFAEPILTVNAGEIIGYCETSKVLHWEIFSPTGAQDAISKLIAKDDSLKNSFIVAEEYLPDNFIEMPEDGEGKNEFCQILGDTLPPEDSDLFNEMFETNDYAESLQDFMKSNQSFAKEGNDDAASRGETTYPVKVVLKNLQSYIMPAGKTSSAIDIIFKSGDTVLPENGSLTLTSTDNREFTIQVPAGATSIDFKSEDFYFDTLTLSQSSNEPADSTLFKTLAPYRWRCIHLKHISEWILDGLQQLLVKLKDAKKLSSTLLVPAGNDINKLVELLKPVIWWNANELPIIGDSGKEQKLFGTQLPSNGYVSNIHPVTALWLINLLMSRGLVSIAETFEPDSKESEDDSKVLFADILSLSKTIKYGSNVFLCAIYKGYPEGKITQFSFNSSGIRSAVSKKGTAITSTALSSWGTLVFDVMNKENKSLLDTSQQKTLTIAKPEVSGSLIINTVKVKKSPDKKVGILKISNCGENVPAFVGFQYVKIAKTAKPVFTGMELSAEFVIAVTAQMTEQLQWDGDYIIGKLDEAHDPKVSKNFAYSEYYKVKSGNFRLHKNLVEQIQLYRNQLPDDKTWGITIDELDSTGLSAKIRTVDVSKMTELKRITGKELETFGNHKCVTIEVSETSTGGAKEYQFEVPFKEASRWIAEHIAMESSECVYVKPYLLIPNGGHGIDVDIDEETGIAGVSGPFVQVVSSDCIKIESDTVLGPIHHYAIGDITFRMGLNSIITDSIFEGECAVWNQANPKIKLIEESKLYGKLEKRQQTNVLTEPWTLKNRWNKTLTFVVELQNEVSAPIRFEGKKFDITTIPEVKPIKGVVENDCIILSTTGHCIPLSSNFTIECFRKNGLDCVPDLVLRKKVQYVNKSNADFHGTFDAYSRFEAHVQLSLLTTEVPEYKFVLKVKGGKIDTFTINETSICYDTVYKTFR